MASAAARRARATEVLVVGAGPIGIAATIFAKLRGTHVSVLDLHPGRLAFSRDVLKADAVFEGGGDIDDRLKRATDGDFFDLVVDATGSPAAMRKGFSYVAHAGAYVLLSIVRDEIGFFRPRIPQARDHAAGQPQRDARGFRACAGGDAGRPRADRCPGQPSRRHRRRAGPDPGLERRPEAGVIKALVEV